MVGNTISIERLIDETVHAVFDEFLKAAKGQHGNTGRQRFDNIATPRIGLAGEFDKRIASGQPALRLGNVTWEKHHVFEPEICDALDQHLIIGVDAPGQDAGLRWTAAEIKGEPPVATGMQRCGDVNDAIHAARRGEIR